MTTKNNKVSIAEAKAHFSEVVGKATFGDEEIIIEKRGKPVAVIINFEKYKRLQKKTYDPDYSFVEEINRHREELKKKLGGPLPDSSEDIREMREERMRDLEMS